MKIVFLRYFKGVLAYEHEFLNGEEAELPDEIAQHLIDKGRAANAEAYHAALYADLMGSDIANSQVEIAPEPVYEAVDEPEKPKKGKGKAAIYG